VANKRLRQPLGEGEASIAAAKLDLGDWGEYARRRAAQKKADG
jgi:hypothetical protein